VFWIQRDAPRRILRRLFGIQGTPGPEQVEDFIYAVVEIGRRGEFDLLFEQGIIPFHAAAERPNAAAGELRHMMVASTGQPQGYHVVLERVEFNLSVAMIIRAFVGGANTTQNNVPVVSPRDARYGIGVDLVNLVQVQDGVTAAVTPPGAGARFVWSGVGPVNTVLTWTGPQLLRTIEDTGATPAFDQITFQNNVLASTLNYTVYGYLVPARVQI
jgi:hypothetical protein